MPVKIDGGQSYSCEKCFGEMVFHRCFSVLCTRPFYRLVCTAKGCGNFGPPIEEGHFLSIMEYHKRNDGSNAI